MRDESECCVLSFRTEEAILSRFYQEGHPENEEYHRNVIRKLENEKLAETREEMKDAYTNCIWAIITEYDL